MDQFPHLNFVQKITGKPRLFGGGEPNPITALIKQDRKGHSDNLFQQTSKLKEEWINSVTEREAKDLPALEPHIIPVFLQINPDLLSSEFNLQNIGIEIISEEEDGFIVGASFDSLKSLEEKIEGFITEKHGSGIIGDLWKIFEGDRETWKPRHILSNELFQRWNDISDNETLQVEVSIAFDKPLGKEPNPEKRGGEKRLERYRQLQIERDDRLMERENHFDNFIELYGQRLSDFIHLEDSFFCEIEISGKGFKDLAKNYPFVFEINEGEDVGGITGDSLDDSDIDIEIIPPTEDSPEVGVIDSGIMQNHRYIESAIKPGNSKIYIHSEISSADEVASGGHGTRVAGAILYPIGITGLPVPYQLPCFVRNLKVLDSRNSLITKFPAQLMNVIVDDNEDCQIFNLSVCSKTPYRIKHMSTWAATIDSIIHGKNILFIISAGNIYQDSISTYLNNNEIYPTYLQNPYCRIANPGQSSFSLTVGSLNHANFEDDDWKSLGIEHEISPYSRIGPGIWGNIKPDVVEFGGGLVVSKNGSNLIREHIHTSTELVRSTLHGGGAYGKDRIGTSFSAPKVTHIVAQLKKLYPEENINLLRALVIQGARLPSIYFQKPTKVSIQHFGYGLPVLERVTTNSDFRISFYNTGEIKTEEGHIYSLKIPDNLRDQGNEYDILIEVTLCYTAKVRRTRQKTRSYLSSWVDWTSSKIDEPFDDFKEFVLKEIENTATDYDKDARKKLDSLPWKIGYRSDRGEVEEFNRNDSTAQKDWAIIKSFQLPRELSFAVRAHKGWDKNNEEVPYAITVSLEILGAHIPIYEEIRIENEIELPV